MTSLAPRGPLRGSVRAPGGMVCAADHLAAQAGADQLVRGGNAADAALAANAVMAVVAPHLCGMGGDLFAIVHRDGDGAPAVLDASGRAGAGLDPDELRAEGRSGMPFRHDMRSVTVPGCVDGWMALHERFGSRPLDDVFDAALTLAEEGFPASPLLVGSLATVDEPARRNLVALAPAAVRPGERLRRGGVAMALRDIIDHGRSGFYEGQFGDGFLELSNGVHTPEDLARAQADWVDPLGVDVWGHRVWTVPPASQGYLILAGAWIAQGLELPDDPDDPLWAHLLIEASLEAGHDRPDVLFDGADGAALVDPGRLGRRRARIRPDTTFPRSVPAGSGDTTYLCAVDRDRMGVSLIQSNASGFGSWLVEPRTGINLHNRGLGFNLRAGHPAEAGPGRRPPHTLCPGLVTDAEGRLHAVLGTMGGDAQPQIVLQLLARLLAAGQGPAAAVQSGRFALAGEATGFDSWVGESGPAVLVEGHAPETWEAALMGRGHRARRVAPWDSGFGHAHAIVVERSGMLAGAADARCLVGAAAGVW